MENEMANNEDYLDALAAYSKKPSREIPAILEQYLNSVAKNGETLFTWQLLKPLIVGKLDQVIEDLRQRQSSENIPERPNVENVLFDVMRARIMDAVHKFNGAPFTIQRLCELLIDPKQHYKRSDKFMRGLEKNVLVVSTVDPFGSSHSNFFCRKVFSESGTKNLVNGGDTHGSLSFPRESNISSNLPPVPCWVTTTLKKTTQPQNTIPAELKPTQKVSPTVVSADGPAQSVYPHHGEQPPAVHAEEVIEETVVTMDTSEAGTIATDGGEAMAEENDSEVMGDDTNDSSCPSSSSEVSTSDTNGNSSTLPEMTIVTSSCEIQTKPWTEIASERENKNNSPSSSILTDSNNITNLSQKSETLSEDCSPDRQMSSPSYSEAMSSHMDHSEDDLIDSFTESSLESSSRVSSQQKSLSNNSCGFDASIPISETMVAKDDSQCHVSETMIAKDDSQCCVSETMVAQDDSQCHVSETMVAQDDSHGHVSETMVSQDDSQCHVSETMVAQDDSQCHVSETMVTQDDSHCLVSKISDSNNASTLNIDCDNSVTGSDDFIPTSSVASSSPVPLQLHEPSSSNIDIYTDITALSSDSISTNDTHLNSDSVTGLERLVESVERSPQTSHSSSVPISTLSPTKIIQKKQVQLDPSLLSSSDSSSDCKEPPTEHIRMSDTASCPSVSSTTSSIVVSTSSEIKALSSLDAVARSDMMADTTSDSISKIPTVQSLDTFCSRKDPNLHIVGNITQENVTSPPSQFVPSVDSPCLNVVNILQTNSNEEKQSEEVQAQEDTELETLISESENMHESMDQD